MRNRVESCRKRPCYVSQVQFQRFPEPTTFPLSLALYSLFASSYWHVSNVRSCMRNVVDTHRTPLQSARDSKEVNALGPTCVLVHICDAAGSLHREAESKYSMKLREATSSSASMTDGNRALTVRGGGRGELWGGQDCILCVTDNLIMIPSAGDAPVPVHARLRATVSATVLSSASEDRAQYSNLRQ